MEPGYAGLWTQHNHRRVSHAGTVSQAAQGPRGAQSVAFSSCQEWGVVGGGLWPAVTGGRGVVTDLVSL